MNAQLTEIYGPQQPAMFILPIADGAIKAILAIHNEIESLRLVMKQIKALEAKRDAAKKTISSYMGDCNKLADLDGTIAVTYARGQDVVKLNAKAVKEHFADVYAACSEIEQAPRRFLVK